MYVVGFTPPQFNFVSSNLPIYHNGRPMYVDGLELLLYSIAIYKGMQWHACYKLGVGS